MKGSRNAILASVIPEEAAAASEAQQRSMQPRGDFVVDSNSLPLLNS